MGRNKKESKIEIEIIDTSNSSEEEKEFRLSQALSMLINKQDILNYLNRNNNEK